MSYPKILNVVLYLFITILLILNNYAFSTPQQDEEIIEEEEVLEGTEAYPKETISIVDLSRLLQSSDSEIVISDFEITSSPSDSEFLIDKIFFSQYEIDNKSGKPKKIYFYNCQFKLDSQSPLVLKNWNFIKLNIVGCSIESPIEFLDCSHTSNYPVLIENCSITDDLQFTGSSNTINQIRFNNNDISTCIKIDNPIASLSVKNCRFFANADAFTLRDAEKTHYQFDAGNIEIGNGVFVGNSFNNAGVQNLFSLNLESSALDELTMYYNTMQTLNLSFAEVGKSLLIDSLSVENYIGILNFDFPEANTNVPWYNLGGEKFTIFYTDDSEIIIPYQAKSDMELSNNLFYNDLISAYSKFNTLYHDRGDIRSANSSYVEIKDIETRRQAFIQQIDPSLNNLINYKLNVFLRFFSDYATNPGKSLILSIWVLLIFTILYMFSFSRWDGMNYKFYMYMFSRFATYLTTNDPIDKVFNNDMALENNDIQELRKKYKKEGKEMPRILKLFGGPLHFLGKFRYDIIPGMIKILNFQPGSWNDLKGNGLKKIWSGFLIILITVFFMIYVLIVKFLNSLLLSLNSFVVIGFGALPEQDEWFAMFLSIIEGIIGWFLLTIFTITLLSQVLQNA